MVNLVLLQAGKFLNNPSAEIQDSGLYKMPNPGMDGHGNTTTLSDKWFAGKTQSMDVVKEAARQAVGVDLQTDASGTVTGINITDRAKYNATIQKQVDKMYPPGKRVCYKI